MELLLGDSRSARPLRPPPLRSVLAWLLASALFFAPCLDAAYDAYPAALPAKDKKQKQDPVLKGLPVTDLTPDQAVFHALNRLAYGPRPGDVERIKQIGLAKWIDQQLNPNSIEDKAVQSRLEALPTLHLGTAKLIQEYPPPKQAAKQAGVTLQEYKKGQAQARSDAAAAMIARDSQADADLMAAPKSISEANISSPMKQVSANITTPGTAQRGALSVDPNAVPRAIADDSKRPQRVIEELAMAKMTRAIYSDRQLQQVMDDFWFNHFNVFAGKGEDRYYLTSYERDVIAPHALGKFKDLVSDSAKSPAMLFYLDNFLSADPRTAQRLAPDRAMRQRARRLQSRTAKRSGPEQKEATTRA
jgi:uncharacterized protein (DUF1800 family)